MKTVATLMAVITIVVFSGQPAHASCPTNFIMESNGRCYFFNPATRRKYVLSWFNARAECQALNADLVSFETDTEFKIITAHLFQLYGNTRDVNFWTGARYVTPRAIWIATNQPTNLRSDIETYRVTSTRPCGRIYYDSNGGYSHRGLTCPRNHWRRVGYVCEIQ